MDSKVMTLAVKAPDVSGLGLPIYANVAHVSSTPYDFRITFSMLTTSLDGSAGLVAEPPQAIAEVVIPVGAVESLVDLLRAELGRFVDEFGEPRPAISRSDGNGSGAIGRQ